jgi:hypothetical protein
MSTNASVSLNEISGTIQSINTTMSTAFSDFVHSMQHVGEKVRSGAMSDAQAWRNTADWFSQQYETAKNAALSAAQKATQSGDTSTAEFWQKRAQSYSNIMAERITMTDAAWLRGNAALNVVDSLRSLGGTLAHSVGVAGFAFEAAQMLDAAIRGDWDRVGEVSVGMIGAASFGYAGLAVAAAFIAPTAAGGVVIAGVVGGLFAIVGHILGVKAWTNNFFEAATRALAADPLTVDLDGDGIETVGINSSTPVMFDITGTGVLQSVGWVGADDGFLVRDLNSNGLIDSGAELFGDATQLANGQRASDGFAALADLDENQDGVVNAADAAFSSLRVWRDLDQDGVTDAGELLTLTALGITGLNVASTSHSQTLANGNQIADLGTYIRSDGQVGTLGQTADVNLAVDTFTSQFADTLPVSEAVNDISWEQAA